MEVEEYLLVVDGFFENSVLVPVKNGVTDTGVCTRTNMNGTIEGYRSLEKQLYSKLFFIN